MKPVQSRTGQGQSGLPAVLGLEAPTVRHSPLLLEEDDLRFAGECWDSADIAAAAVGGGLMGEVWWRCGDVMTKRGACAILGSVRRRGVVPYLEYPLIHPCQSYLANELPLEFSQTELTTYQSYILRTNCSLNLPKPNQPVTLSNNLIRKIEGVLVEILIAPKGLTRTNNMYHRGFKNIF